MPTAAHVIYIPGVLLLGVVIGFILAGRAQKAAEAEKAERDKRRAERAAERAAAKPDEKA
jgi:hypothetical protein